MPTPLEILGNLDGYGVWLAGVVGGLTALGWFLRKAWKGTRSAYARGHELARKIDALDVIARRELTDGEGGPASTKDYARIAAGHALAIEKLEHADRTHEARLKSLEDWRELLEQGGF